jgi:hypothetical protein
MPLGYLLTVIGFVVVVAIYLQLEFDMQMRDKKNIENKILSKEELT